MDTQKQYIEEALRCSGRDISSYSTCDTQRFIANRICCILDKFVLSLFKHCIGNRLVPLVKQELFTLPEHVSSHTVFSGVCVTWSLVLCVCFFFIVVCPFVFDSVDHFIFCPFWFTDSDYYFLGIFKFFFENVSIYIQSDKG